MKKRVIYLLTASLMLTLIACDKSNGPGETPDPGEKPEPLVLPSNLKVDSVSYESVMVRWDGNADLYEVEIGDVPVFDYEGTACGVDGLRRETPYTWRVRGKRGDEVTDWVNGSSFTTTKYVDPREVWVGDWTAQHLRYNLMVSNISVPVDELIPSLPEDFDPDELLSFFNFKIEKVGGEGDRELKVTLPLLTALELPDYFQVPVEGKQLWVEQELTDTLTILSTSTPISDIPYISEILDLGELLENITIEEVRLGLNTVRITLGPVEGAIIPTEVIIAGEFFVKTSDPAIDMVISMLARPKVRFTMLADLTRINNEP